MKQLFRNDEPLNSSPTDASAINYNNTVSGLAATNVQKAVDELNTKLFNINTGGNNMTIHEKLDAILAGAGGGSIDNIADLYANSSTSSQTKSFLLKKGQIAIITLGTNNTAGTVSLTLSDDSAATLVESDANSVSPYMLNTYVYKALSDLTINLNVNINAGSSYISYTILETSNSELFSSTKLDSEFLFGKNTYTADKDYKNVTLFWYTANNGSIISTPSYSYNGSGIATLVRSGLYSNQTTSYCMVTIKNMKANETVTFTPSYEGGNICVVNTTQSFAEVGDLTPISYLTSAVANSKYNYTFTEDYKEIIVIVNDAVTNAGISFNFNGAIREPFLSESDTNDTKLTYFYKLSNVKTGDIINITCKGAGFALILNSVSSGNTSGGGNSSVIQLTSNYSSLITQAKGTATATFTLPTDKEYVGAGLCSITYSVGQVPYGGVYGDISITEENGIITVSIPICGNWGNTTVTGTITLNVFVVDK